MKKAHYFRFILLALVLILPLSRLNTEVETISSIDNKYLTSFPDINLGFTSFMQQLNNYLTERLGGRGRLIQLNGVLNDKLFGYLEHSLYEYGEDGYVFSKLKRLEKDFTFLDQFTDFLLQVQNYCLDREVPFVYILNPAKFSVYSKYLPIGYRYKNERLEFLQDSLNEKGIIHVDTTELLMSLAHKEQVFNRKFDAGHWNSLGAFHSVNELLSKMNEYDPTITPNDIQNYLISEKLETHYPVSNIIVNEYVPVLTQKVKNWEYTNMDIRNDLIISDQHRAVFRTRSNVNNDVKLLMFQGSGFNGLAHPFIASAVKSYQSIHNYQNLINFDYYFNIFQPTFVVVNSAEYATTSGYFSLKKMQEKHLNSVLDAKTFRVTGSSIKPVDVEHGKYLLTVWFKLNDVSHGYVDDNQATYDLVKSDNEDYWYFSALYSNIDLSKAKIYLVKINGQKICFDLEEPNLDF